MDHMFYLCLIFIGCVSAQPRPRGQSMQAMLGPPPAGPAGSAPGGAQVMQALQAILGQSPAAPSAPSAPMPSRSHRMHAMHGQTLRASAGAQCPTLKKWMKFTDRMTGNSTCVWHSDVEMTFAEAWTWCDLLGAHVTSIYSVNIQQYLCLWSRLNKPGKTWIGLNSMEVAGSYRWAHNGKRPAILLQVTGQSIGSQDRCVYLDNVKCTLRADSCTNKNRFICEKHF